MVAPLSLLGTSLFVGTAHASDISCATTPYVVTADVTFHEDVGPCPGDGLVVAASGTALDPITIDLNGHRLFGTSGLDDANGVGVVIDGQSHVVVTSSVAGGQIDRFDAAVRIDGQSAAATDNMVSDLTLRDNFSEDPSGADNGEGVAIVGPQADDNTVSNNAIVNNGPFGGVSVYGGNNVVAANHITGTDISDNTIEDNRSQSSQTDGIRLENWTWSSTVTGNTITGSALDGIALFADTQSTTVSDNTVTDNGASGDPSHRPGHGIVAFARTSTNTIDDNTVNDNAGSGIFLNGPIQPTNPMGTAIPGSLNNTVSDNTALGNGTNPTVLVEGPPATVSVTVRASATAGGVTVDAPGQLPLQDGPWYDLKDGNTSPPCDNNSWSGNTYGTRNQTCIN